MPLRASVIVPTFNAAATLRECLAALQAQTLPADEFEVFVVDDGSTDATAAVASEFPAVKVLKVPHRGAATARNAGVAAARGPVVAMTDADCAPSPEWLERMITPFSDPDVAGVKGTYRTRQRGLVPRFVQCEYEEKYSQMKRWATIDFVDTYAAAYRREVFLAHGGFDESFPSASVEDQEFSFRLAKAGCKLVLAPDATVYHYHPETAAAYARRKFRIGYWKVPVHRRHPDKVWRDSHTPATLKLQVVLLPVGGALLLASPWQPVALWGSGLAGAGFVLSAIPLLRRIAASDRRVVPLALWLIALRAGALSAGLAVGAFGEVMRVARRRDTAYAAPASD